MVEEYTFEFDTKSNVKTSFKQSFQYDYITFINIFNTHYMIWNIEINNIKKTSFNSNLI